MFMLAVDTGGTFTDLAAYAPELGQVRFTKALTTYNDLLEGAPCSLAVTFERYSYPPWGLHGSGAGKPGYVEIERPGKPIERVLKVSDLKLQANDRVRIYTAGGGDYGEPKLRDPAILARDIEEGYVSTEAAVRDYGQEFMQPAAD